MNKKELFKKLKKNLRDFKNAKIGSVKPNGKHLAMDNFEFYYRCFYPLQDKIHNLADFTKKDEAKLSRLKMKLERIKQMPYVLDELGRDEDGYYKIITRRIGC